MAARSMVRVSDSKGSILTLERVRSFHNFSEPLGPPQLAGVLLFG